MRSIVWQFVALTFLLFAAGCVATDQERDPATPAGAADSPLVARLGMLESRIIGLTDDLDRLARRVVAMERSGSAESRKSPASPGESPAPESEAVPPEPDEPRPESVPALRPEPPPAPPPAAPERNLDDWPTPAAGRGRATALLFDARELSSGSLPSTSHRLWRIVDPGGETLLTQKDVDPAVLSSRPVFWVAPAKTVLGPAALPMLGNRPLELRVSGAVLAHGEAIMTLDAASAAALRKTGGYLDLAKAGTLAILLREP